MYREGVTEKELGEYYKVHVSLTEPMRREHRNILLIRNDQAPRKLSFWCFHAGLAMADLVRAGVRSVVLTSGTLSPLSAFAAELSLPFPIRLENPHVIADWQVQCAVYSHGPDGTLLESSFKNRDDKCVAMRFILFSLF